MNGDRTTPDNPPTSEDAADNHTCKPDATVYYCPTARDTESDCHGGFNVCCAQPELHQQLLQCSLAYTRWAHPGHSWKPQPGMKRVRCKGYRADPADAWPAQSCGRKKPHPAHKFMRGRTAGQCPGVQQEGNPPGSTRKQLPADVLTLFPPSLAPATRSYLSHACRTARLVDWLIIQNPGRDDLLEHRDRLHQDCAGADPYTGTLCHCPCHPTTPEQSPFSPLMA